MTKTASEITLHGVMSPNVVKVAIMLEELGLAYTLKFVALFNGEQFSPAFLKLNPLGKVPVLEDPALDIPLAESGAILIWLGEHHQRFLPQKAPDRYEVFQWLMVQMSAVGPMLGQFTHFRLLPPGSEPYSYGRYAALAEKLYRAIDNRLVDRNWIAGAEYSIADIATYPWADYIERHDIPIDDYPNMKRWRDQIASRAAVMRAKERVYGEFAEASSQTMQQASNADLDRFFGRSDKVPAQDYSAVKDQR